MTTTEAFPPETLSAIFISCSELDADERPSLVLGRVCSRWRRVAIATPQLWTKINVGCSNNLNHFDLREARAVLSYHDSADSNIPLSLHANWKDVNPKFGETRAAFTELIVAHSSRWTNISLQLFFSVEGFGAIARAMRGFPSLTTLEVTLPTSCAPPAEFSTLHFFQNLGRGTLVAVPIPSLQHLKLDFRGSRDPASGIVGVMGNMLLPALSSFTFLTDTDVGFAREIVWGQLTSLLKRSGHPPLRTISTTYHAGPIEAVLEALEHTPYLESLTLFTFYSLHSLFLASTLPGRDLEVDGHSAFMYAPNLKELCIDQLERETFEEVIELLSMRWEGGKGPLKKVIIVLEEGMKLGRKERKEEYDEIFDDFIKEGSEKLKGLEIVKCVAPDTAYED